MNRQCHGQSESQAATPRWLNPGIPALMECDGNATKATLGERLLGVYASFLDKFASNQDKPLDKPT